MASSFIHTWIRQGTHNGTGSRLIILHQSKVNIALQQIILGIKELIHQILKGFNGLSHIGRDLMLLLAKLVLHVGQNGHEGGSVDHLVSQHLRVSIQQPDFFTVRQGYTLITVRVNTAGINAIGSKVLVISHKLVIATRDNLVTLSNYVLDGLSNSQRLRTRYLALHAVHQSLNGTTVKNRDTGFMRDSKGHIRTTFGNVCIVICHSSSIHQLGQFFLVELGQLVSNLMRFTHQFNLASHQIRGTSSSHLIHAQVHLFQDIVTCLNI